MKPSDIERIFTDKFDWFIKNLPALHDKPSSVTLERFKHIDKGMEEMKRSIEKIDLKMEIQNKEVLGKIEDLEDKQIKMHEQNAEKFEKLNGWRIESSWKLWLIFSLLSFVCIWVGNLIFKTIDSRLFN